MGSSTSIFLGRTVTITDNICFALPAQNTAPIHVDRAYAAQTEFGKPLVDSTFTLALVGFCKTAKQTTGEIAN